MPLSSNSPTGSTFTASSNCHQHPRANQDLSGLGFIAKPRRNIGYRSDGGVIETSLKANGAESRKSVRNTDAKANLMSQPTPFLVNDLIAVRISSAICTACRAGFRQEQGH